MRTESAGAPLLSVKDLHVVYSLGGGRKLEAVNEVNLDVAEGESVGIVGETGCGKSSLAQAIMQLPPPDSGSVQFAGQELTELSGKRLRRARRDMQMIFQDPAASVNPRRRVRDIVAEPLAIWGEEVRTRALTVSEALDAVGLDIRVVGDRTPDQLSGGQCQRVCLARALVIRPRMLICDEPVSSLDVSIQAQILNLLEDARTEFGLSMLFIAHDLAAVKNVSDRVVVMYLGRVCEIAPAQDLYATPRHHYTSALFSSIPQISDDPASRRTAPTLEGEVPSPIDPPSGCRFRTRCPRAEDLCAREVPQPQQRDIGHIVACHFPLAGDRDAGARVANRDGHLETAVTAPERVGTGTDRHRRERS